MDLIEDVASVEIPKQLVLHTIGVRVPFHGRWVTFGTV